MSDEMVGAAQRKSGPDSGGGMLKSLYPSRFDRVEPKRKDCV